MRFLLDEDVHPGVAEAGGGLGLDIVSVHGIGRRGLADLEQLEFAAAEGRVLVTRNRNDFIRLTVSSFHAGAKHPGVVIVPHTLRNSDPGRIGRALKVWFEEHRDTEISYAIFFLK